MNSHPPSSILHPRGILVRGTNWLGDAVMTTPALARLREKFPDAHIALLTPEKLRELWLHHPAVNETISFASDEGVFATGKKLRAGKFDLALVLPNSPRSAIETWLAQIPQRIGHARPWRNFFLTNAITPRTDAVKMRKRSVAEIKKLISQLPAPSSRLPASAHQIHEYLHLVAALGANPEPIAPQLFVTPDEIGAAKKKFGLEKITGPVFGLNPGAEYGPAKRWPVDRFITATREIQKSDKLCLADFRRQGRHGAIAEQIQFRNPQLRNSATSKPRRQNFSLRELMSLLKLCRVLLTNDSGPMHVAAALGTPVVALFGSTSPELTGPGLPGDPWHRLLKSDAPCSPCFLRECPIDFRCMNGITIERVVEAVVEALKG